MNEIILSLNGDNFIPSFTIWIYIYIYSVFLVGPFHSYKVSLSYCIVESFSLAFGYYLTICLVHFSVSNFNVLFF